MTDTDVSHSATAVASQKVDATVERVEVSVYRVPTDFPESDGTGEWDSTTVVLVEVSGGGTQGIGYTYTSASAAGLIREKFAKIVTGANAMDTSHCWTKMNIAIR